MKLLSIFAAVSLISCVHSRQHIEPIYRTFEPKTVHISSTTGGISHIAWTLEIGKVLAQRGHNVSFITDDDSVKFAKPYLPEVSTISMGPGLSKQRFRDFFTTHFPLDATVRNTVKNHYRNVYDNHFHNYMEIFQTSNTSMAICDIMAIACADAAEILNIPLVIHMTMSNAEDTAAPFINHYFTTGPATTKDQSIFKRFYMRYIYKVRLAPRYLSIASQLQETRRLAGVHKPIAKELYDAVARHSGAIKMINGFWGLESPRPVGPFVEYVGPIIGTTYDAMPESMTKFMDERNRVVYIAFGQTFSPSGPEFEALLKGLLDAYESNYFDGFIWSFSKNSREQPDLPKQVRTQSGAIYNVKDLFDGKYGADLRFETWSPQFAILQHAHCKLFISHGGASSLHESLFNGVPLLLHPFATDQPANAHAMKDAGVGLLIDRAALSSSNIVEKIGTILSDKEGTFKSNMDSMQALVHSRKNKKEHAADMLEEVMNSVRKNGDIWYRKEAVAHMNFLKANNIDVDLFALFLFVSVVYLVRQTYNKMSFVYGFLFVPPSKKTYKTA